LTVKNNFGFGFGFQLAQSFSYSTSSVLSLLSNFKFKILKRKAILICMKESSAKHFSSTDNLAERELGTGRLAQGFTRRMHLATNEDIPVGSIRSKFYFQAICLAKITPPKQRS